ncbi:MAG: AzlC family ABC transporter permease [bacterium]
MAFQQSMTAGARASVGFLISTFLFGLLFGLAAASAGIQQSTALFMSASVFSASAQFAALEFWQTPLPLGSIALSVALVSSRNILLGMSLTHQLDGYSLPRRLAHLALLTDPAAVMLKRLDSHVDRLGYMTGYGLALFASWLCSTWAGFTFGHLLTGARIESLDFAGPLVMATMMVLFAKGSRGPPLPWLVSGAVSLLMFEIGMPTYAILPIAVSTGVIVSLLYGRTND